MGSPKLLLPWGDTTLIKHVLGVWLASRVDRVIVVVAPDDEPLAAACREVHVVRKNPPPAEMKDSICYGLEAAAEIFAAGPGDAWLVAPADMPYLQPTAINALLDAYAAHTHGDDAPSKFFVAEHQGRRGHPVLFPWSLAAEVHLLQNDQGLNTITGRYPAVGVEVSSRAMFDDIDTPEDYDRQRPR
jgi:molybdenum cofactor cytidylyltransferase